MEATNTHPALRYEHAVGGDSAYPFIECSFNANIGHTLPPHWAMDTWAFFSSFL
jgi:hypothetical protein